jgi:hypothetical protein
VSLDSLRYGDGESSSRVAKDGKASSIISVFVMVNSMGLLKADTLKVRVFDTRNYFS